MTDIRLVKIEASISDVKKDLEFRTYYFTDDLLRWIYKLSVEVKYSFRIETKKKILDKAKTKKHPPWW